MIAISLISGITVCYKFGIIIIIIIIIVIRCQYFGGVWHDERRVALGRPTTNSSVAAPRQPPRQSCVHIGS